MTVSAAVAVVIINDSPTICDSATLQWCHQGTFCIQHWCPQKIGNCQAHVTEYNFLLWEKSKILCLLAQAWLISTLMCDRGTIYSILHVTSECQTMPWNIHWNLCATQTGGVSLWTNISRYPSQRKGCYISLGNTILVARSQAKMENRSGRGRT